MLNVIHAVHVALAFCAVDGLDYGLYGSAVTKVHNVPCPTAGLWSDVFCRPAIIHRLAHAALNINRLLRVRRSPSQPDAGRLGPSLDAAWSPGQVPSRLARRECWRNV
jgi:hypothetical protein